MEIAKVGDMPLNVELFLHSLLKETHPLNIILRLKSNNRNLMEIQGG